ncbi:MAG: hypothetical protein D6E12_10625 [Desulfovibrio sp.]|nr:MAG: hypothetical protein D6E12_10625 [Desulfovibrio sp.]
MKTFVTLVYEILIYVLMLAMIGGLTVFNEPVTGPLQQLLGRELGDGVKYGVGFVAGLLGSIMTFGMPLAILQINSNMRKLASALNK